MTETRGASQLGSSQRVAHSTERTESSADGMTRALIAAGQGDYRAFEQLYRMASPRLYSVCLRVLRRRELAEDALQDGFVRIWHSAAQFDSQRSTAMAWMATVVRNRAIDLLRQESRDPVKDADQLLLEPMAPGAGPLGAALRGAEDDALYGCLDSLEEKERTAIALAFFQGLTHKQLAGALSIPLGSAKSLVRRGLQRLRRCLQS